MKDKHGATIMAINKQIVDRIDGMFGYSGSSHDDNSKDSSKVIIERDLQLVVDAIHDKISVPKDIINLVEDIKKVLSLIKDISRNYCNRVYNRNADRVAKIGDSH